jgi:hypothetical protein
VEAKAEKPKKAAKPKEEVAPMKIKIMTTEVTANRRDDLTGELFENVPVSPKPGQDPAKVRWVDSARP